MPTTSKKPRNPATTIHVVGSDGGDDNRLLAYNAQHIALSCSDALYRKFYFNRAAELAGIADAQDALVPLAHQPAGMIPIK